MRIFLASVHDEEIYHARKPIGVYKSTSEGWNVIYKKAMRENMHCWEMEEDSYSCDFHFVITVIVQRSGL